VAAVYRDQIARSITLLRVFVVASALLLAVGALVLGSTVTKTLRRQAVDDAKLGVTQYADSVVGRYVVHDGRVEVPREAQEILRRDVAARKDILSIKVWKHDGTLAWTNLAPERIGKKFEVENELLEVFETGETEAELSRLETEGENAVEARLIRNDVFEVYAPMRASSGRVVGAYEIYSDPTNLRAAVSEGRRTVWIAVGAVFLLLYLTLVLLVRGASRLLRAQSERLRARTQQLADSYRQLETTALETIETLNATVEARDAYTGGHSQRVRRFALAIGAELGFGEEQLASLGHAALLHDVGKVAVPDAILTKPGRLTEEEFDAIKRHPGEGARIVGRLRRLQSLVPAVRYHHERWDGGGYPDGLSADDIPLDASIIGLADAWDAMTSDRPYRGALEAVDAFREVVDGRGTQFSPPVVDAFARALAARPATFGITEPVPAEALVGAGRR
jgi:HD-GYP domain-containing protein (c-di-GMP phosphodiesterase class II)